MKSNHNRAAQLRPEDEVLLACSRLHLAEEQTRMIRERLSAEVDWMALLIAATQHCVTPLVHWHLESTCPELLPALGRSFLQQSFQNNVYQNLYLAAELVRIVDLFAENKVLTIPYKGPLLAQQAYGNLALREFVDLDILVRQVDIPRAWKLMSSLGYSTTLDPDLFQHQSPVRIPGQYSFLGAKGRSIVELHTERTLRYYPVPLDLEQLAVRLEPIALGARQVRTFSAEDALSILGVHGFKHFWNRLSWICDIAALAQAPALNWDKAFARAGELRCEPMLYLGVIVAGDICDAKLPGEVLRRARSSSAAEWLARRIQGKIFSPLGSHLGAAQRFFSRIRMSGSFWDGCRYSLRLATTPTEDDWSQVKLPQPFTGLYAVLRPIRLLRKYGLGGLGQAEPDLSPFVPTPARVAERMLALAEVKPGDVVYDLGCGDGEIVIAAAKRAGVRCVGVDIDPQRIAEARVNARRHGVENMIAFVRANALDVDLSPATVVTLYLAHVANLRLRAKLLGELPPGARVVSRDFQMTEWLPEKTEKYSDPAGVDGKLFLFRMPARGGEAKDSLAADASASQPELTMKNAWRARGSSGG